MEVMKQTQTMKAKKEPNEVKQRWHYHLKWQLESDHSLVLERDKQCVQDAITQWCKEINAQLAGLTLTSRHLQVVCSTKAQLNIHKGLKSLEKKLCKVLSVMELDYILTQHEGKMQDVRVEKVLERLWSAEYYDLDEGVTKDLEAFKAYLAQRKLATLDVGEQTYLIDIEGLAQEINLNCFECTKRYQYGCCCGSPCDMSRKNQRLLDQHLGQLAEEMRQLNSEDYEEVMEKGGFVSYDGSIKACNGRCSLLVKHEEVYKCMAHKYALDHQIPIYEICPLSCLMYPLEVIELITDKKKKVILLTSVVEEDFAKTYGRWGSYKSLEIDHRCVHKEAHNEVFKEAEYKPVYKVNKSLLMYEFGPLMYEGLEALMDVSESQNLA